MKYVIIIPDGAADEPQEALGGKTPLQAANTPHLDALTANGIVSQACHTPGSLPAGSEIGNLSLLGYNPFEYFTGRAPIEAAAQGIELAPGDWAIRCNIVTIVDQVMVDFTANHISTEEATALLADLQQDIAADGRFGALEYRPGVSYRNLLLWRGDKMPAPFTTDTRTEAPHDWTDLSIESAYPRGPGSDLLVELMTRAGERLTDHPANAARRSRGEPLASNVWLWGLGQAPQLPHFADLYGVRGAMITAVDLLRGIAALAGWDRIEVPGATGYLDTDYAAKGRFAIEALANYDLVCVHVEAPDEASHEGRADAKVAALEAIDRDIVGPLADRLASQGPWRMMVSPDHPTFLRTKKHTHGYVPVLMAGSDIEADGSASYDDVTAASGSRRFDQGWELMPWFLKQFPTH